MVFNPPHVENGGGLGETLVWNGVAEEVPFVVAAQPRSYGWGMEVFLPHATAGDIALVPILRCIELPEFREPYFEQSKSCGRFAIVDSDSKRIYRGRKNDSEAVIDYLTSRHFVGYVLAELVEESEPWVIRGPVAGKYFSFIEISSREEDAKLISREMELRSGAPFTIAHEQHST
jgi:hypothetical protein